MGKDDFLILGNKEIWHRLEKRYPSFEYFKRWIVPKMRGKYIVKRKIKHKIINCTTVIALNKYIMEKERNERH